MTARDDAMDRHPAGGVRHPWHYADEDCACGAQRMRHDRPASVRTAVADPRRRTCNASGCDAEGHDVRDHYGIPAGRWCDDHEDQAPGQFAYAGPDTEPLDEDQPNPGWRGEDA